MQGVDDSYDSPLAHPQHPRLRHSTLPYSSSIASCASTSATSVWSNISATSSQSSQSSQFTVDSSDYAFSASSQTSVSSVDSCDVAQPDRQKLATTQSWQKQQQQPLPCQLRQNPRRTGAAPAAVPSLLRQSDRRTTFVDHLVDASTQIVQAIWPLSSVIGRGESGSSGSGSSSSGSYLLPLRTFIQETLRRSRASYSTLQVALYYLLLIKPRLPGHNFTTEQPSDSYACRALQCGRRMFLAALILASKYLQDRNYSARAWSKISGLATAEINQNETAFLHAVDWRLHITNDVYTRWIDCVNRFNPPQLPPSPGPAAVKCFELKCEEFRLLIQTLTPSLDNLDELCLPSTPIAIRRRNSCQMTNGTLSPVAFCSSPEASSPSSTDATPTASSNGIGAVPSIMEPRPITPVSFNTAPQALALGLMPMPRLALPQPGAMAQMLSGNRSSMCFAVAQASSSCSTQFLDRWAGPLASSTSPVGSLPARRSSLANSVSTASSPESMISDSSLVSRCSFGSSSWPLMNAPSTQLPKLEAQARHRFAKQQCSGSGMRDKNILLRPTVIPAVREDEEVCRYATPVFASPEMSYTGPMGKEANEIRLPLDRRSSDVDAADAARALAELQQQPLSDMQFSTYPQRPMSSLKRSRPLSVENSLQDNVRELLRETTLKLENKNVMPEPFVLPLPDRFNNANVNVNGNGNVNVPVADRAAALTGSRKRLCRTSAVVTPRAVKPCPFNTDLQHPSMNGLYGPGMWEGLV